MISHFTHFHLINHFVYEGRRSLLWAEPKHILEAEYEFQNTENLLRASEEFLGEYIWGSFNILICPDFPNHIGGMENPHLVTIYHVKKW